MPLLTSPIDGSPMRQIHRYGIEIDICPTSGGIWLDKGELEKILHLMQEEIEMQNSSRHYQSKPISEKYHNHHEQQKYSEKGYYGSGKYHKKESKMSKIMDLFDF